MLINFHLFYLYLYILLMVICFDELDKDRIESLSLDIFKKYTYATNIEKVEIIKE